MNAGASAKVAKVALRPFLAQDAPLLAEIFRASIEELTADDYSAAQQEAWAAVADDVESFAARLAGQLTLIATIDGRPVGFVSLKSKEQVDLLYVHPAVAGQGVGTALYGALEKLALARGATKLTVDASDTAGAFFERQGFAARSRNTVMVGGEWLANTTMDKKLGAEGDKPATEIGGKPSGATR